MSDHITVVGTIANVPERRTTTSGIPVANFRLATHLRRRDEKSGAWIDGHTNWYSVSAYRGLADHALASFQKGQRVIVTGAFKLREWESNGRHGMSAEIDAHSLGHDLLWGTSRFDRDERPTREGGGAAREEGPMSAEVHADEGELAALDHAAWGVSAPDDHVPF